MSHTSGALFAVTPMATPPARDGKTLVVSDFHSFDNTPTITTNLILTFKATENKDGNKKIPKGRYARLNP